MALGLIHALTEAHLSVPDQVSVVGFDDIPEAAHFSPPARPRCTRISHNSDATPWRSCSPSSSEDEQAPDPFCGCRSWWCGPAQELHRRVPD